MKKYSLPLSPRTLVGAIVTLVHLATFIDVSGQIGTAVGGAVALKAALGDLRETIDGAIVHADVSVKNRLQQVRVEAEALIHQLDTMRDETFQQANASLDRVADKTFDLSQQTRDIIGSLQAETSVALNEKIIQLCEIASAFPLTEVRTFVAGVQPYNLDIPLNDRRIIVQGFFPYVDDKHPAKVSIAGETIPLQMMTRSRLGFDLPDVPLEVDEAIPFTLHIPFEKKWYWWHVKYQDQHDRLRVMNPTPFTFTVTAAKENPQFREEVRGTVPFTDEANTHSGHSVGHVAGVKSAWDVFSVSVPNAGDYIKETVEFRQKPEAHITGDSHCMRRIPWSGNFEGWDKYTIRYTLNAPSIGGHNDTVRDLGISHPSYHTGGGSRSTIKVIAVFTATKRTTPAVSPQAPITLRMKPTDIAEVPLELGSVWHISVVARYGDRWTDTAEVDPQNFSASKPYWAATFANGKLTIRTRARPIL